MMSALGGRRGASDLVARFRDALVLAGASQPEALTRNRAGVSWRTARVSRQAEANRELRVRIGWRYLYGGKRDRLMLLCAGGSALVTLAGLDRVLHVERHEPVSAC